MIFLSYAREDVAQIDRIAKAIDRKVTSVWWDRDCMVPGSDWASQIQTAISRSSHVFVFVTRHLSDKPDSYVFKEVRLAAAERSLRRMQARFIVPVMLDGTAPPNMYIGGVRLSDLHAISASDTRGIIRRIHEIIKTDAALNKVESDPIVERESIPYWTTYDGVRDSFYDKLGSGYRWEVSITSRNIGAVLKRRKEIFGLRLGSGEQVFTVRGTIYYLPRDDSFVVWKFEDKERITPIRFIDGTFATEVCLHDMYDPITGLTNTVYSTTCTGGDSG